MIEAWFNSNVFNILIATFLDDNLFNGKIVNSSAFVHCIYQALIPKINTNHKYQQQMQSINIIFVKKYIALLIFAKGGKTSTGSTMEGGYDEKQTKS